VDTSYWTVDQLDDQVASVRDQFVSTLAHWPARPGALALEGRRA